MDVVDLHDFVRLFGLPTRPRNNMSEVNTEKKIHDTSLSNSSLTLPLSVHNMEAADIEKVPTEASAGRPETPTKVTTALDWTGPDDPENAENWSTAKKAYHICYIGLMCFVMYVSLI